MTGMCQATVDTTSSSRIDKAFGKSWNLRYMFYLVGLIHQPMNNIVRFSNTHPNGDNFGKDHKIQGTHSNLFDLFEDAFGQYQALSYPLSSTTTLDQYVDTLMAAYPKADMTKDITNTDKSSWSKVSYDFGKTFAYTLAEGATPTAEYLGK